MQKISIALATIMLSGSLYAKSNTEKAGDILQIAIPLVAYGTTLYLNDEEGKNEFYKSYGTTLGMTYALKYTVREKRPPKNQLSKTSLRSERSYLKMIQTYRQFLTMQ